MTKAKVEHKLVALGSEVEEQIEALRAIDVETENQAIQLGEWRVHCNELVKAAEKERKLHADPQYKAWQEINKLWKSRKKPFEDAVRLADTKLRAWDSKQLAAAQEAQQRAQEAAEAAREAQALGDQEKASEGFRAAQEAITEAVAPVAKAEGLKKRVNYSAIVKDPVSLLKAAIDDPNLLRFVNFDMAALNKLAAASKFEGQAPGLPGVEFVAETRYAS